MRVLCKLLGKFSILLVLVEMIAGGQALQAAGARGRLQAAGQSLLALVEEMLKVKLCKLLAKDEPSRRRDDRE